MHSVEQILLKCDVSEDGWRTRNHFHFEVQRTSEQLATTIGVQLHAVCDGR